MLKIYFEEVFKYKTSDQVEHIKKLLMAVNVHIAASSLTQAGFALATATAVATGLNMSLNMTSLIGHNTGRVITIVGLYAVVQKAADSSRRLHYKYPKYHALLYAYELEMMYFLIEPLFEQTGAIKAQLASDAQIADIITRMIR